MLCSFLSSYYSLTTEFSTLLFTADFLSGWFHLLNMTLGFQEESLFLFSLEQLPTFINTINSWIIEFNAHNYYTKKILINLVYQ